MLQIKIAHIAYAMRQPFERAERRPALEIKEHELETIGRITHRHRQTPALQQHGLTRTRGPGHQGMRPLTTQIKSYRIMLRHTDRHTHRKRQQPLPGHGPPRQRIGFTPQPQQRFQIHARKTLQHRRIIGIARIHGRRTTRRHGMAGNTLGTVRVPAHAIGTLQPRQCQRSHASQHRGNHHRGKHPLPERHHHGDQHELARHRRHHDQHRQTFCPPRSLPRTSLPPWPSGLPPRLFSPHEPSVRWSTNVGQPVQAMWSEPRRFFTFPPTSGGFLIRKTAAGK